MLITIAIAILWLAIGIIVILGVVWGVLYALKIWFTIPDKVEKSIWVIVFILIAIAALTIATGMTVVVLEDFSLHILHY